MVLFHRSKRILFSLFLNVKNKFANINDLENDKCTGNKN